MAGNIVLKHFNLNLSFCVLAAVHLIDAVLNLSHNSFKNLDVNMSG